MIAWGNAWACALNVVLYERFHGVLNLIFAIPTGIVAVGSVIVWTYRLYHDLWA